jgi:hypothetical protein
MKQRSRADLLAVYQKYLNGFVTEDMDAINECIEFMSGKQVSKLLTTSRYHQAK